MHLFKGKDDGEMMMVSLFHDERSKNKKKRKKSLSVCSASLQSDEQLLKGNQQSSLPASCCRLSSELPGSLGGRLHGTHGRRPQAALLQGVKPVNGRSTWGADLRAELGRMFPRVT